MLTLVTSGSAYAFVTGNFDPNFNSVFATSSSDDGKGGGSSDSDNGGSSSDNNEKSKSSSEGGDGGKGGSSDSDNGGSSSDNNEKSKSSSEGGDGGKGGSSDISDGGGSDSSSTSTSPPATEENTSPPSEITPPQPLEENTAPQTQTQPTCADDSLPDANGNCPSPAAEQNALSTPPPQTNQQTCPDGAAPDANGVCPTTSEGAPPTNTPQEQPTANMLTGGIQTAAPITSPPPPPSPEPSEGCPGHVTRNANGICLSPLSKDSPCAEGFHHDASGKCVDNKIPLTDGTCAGGYSLENIDGKNTCNGKGVGLCPGNVARDANGICFDLRPNTPCAQDFHRDTVINGGKCVYNSIPYAGFCALGWHKVPDGCASNSMPLEDGTCYGGYHLVSSTTEKGKKLSNCSPNEFPISAGTCANSWYFVAAWNGCMPGLPVQPGGKCPKGYHKTLMNVKDKDNLCAADPDTLTKLTTPPQSNQPPTQTGGGAGTQPTSGGGTGTGTMPATPRTGGTTGTNTNPTTTPTPPPTSTTTTTTTNVINRGGSSGGGSAATTNAPTAQTTNNFLTYVNAINKISIKYPSTWTKTELVGNPSIPVMFNAPTTTAAPNTATSAKTNFVISITPRATNLDSFTLQQINGLIQSKAVKYIITDTNAKILTPPTSITSYREISYDGMKNNNGVQVPLKGAAIFFVNAGTGYSLLYLAKQTEYTQNIPVVQQMVNSFQVGAAGSAGGGPVQNVAAASNSR